MRERIIGAFGGAGNSSGAAAAPDTWPKGTPALNGKKLIPAAVLVPLISYGDGMTVLLTRRTENLTSHSGQISFPGGRRERVDRTPEETALRETEEEIGLPRDRVELVGRLSAHDTGTGYRVMPMVGLIAPPFPLVPDPSEVAEVFEVPLDYVLDPANHRFETRIHRGSERQFAVMPYGEYFIWGLTARLLLELSQRLSD